MAPGTTPFQRPPPQTPLAGAGIATRAAAIIADKAAVDHVMDVLTSTLRSGSLKDNPYHLVRDHVRIDKTLDFFTLVETMLTGDIRMFEDVNRGVLKTDAKGNEMTFSLTEVEIRRLLGVAFYWDNVVAQTPGGIPDVSEWDNLTETVLAATLRNANAGKARVAPFPPPPRTAAMVAAATAASASANFEKGTRRSVSDYKIFRAQELEPVPTWPSCYGPYAWSR
jgi:hypothetical protein